MLPQHHPGDGSTSTPCLACTTSTSTTSTTSSTSTFTTSTTSPHFLPHLTPHFPSLYRTSISSIPRQPQGRRCPHGFSSARAPSLRPQAAPTCLQPSSTTRASATRHTFTRSGSCCASSGRAPRHVKPPARMARSQRWRPSLVVRHLALCPLRPLPTSRQHLLAAHHRRRRRRHRSSSSSLGRARSALTPPLLKVVRPQQAHSPHARRSAHSPPQGVRLQ